MASGGEGVDAGLWLLLRVIETGEGRGLMRLDYARHEKGALRRHLAGGERLQF